MYARAVTGANERVLSEPVSGCRSLPETVRSTAGGPGPANVYIMTRKIVVLLTTHQS